MKQSNKVDHRRCGHRGRGRTGHQRRRHWPAPTPTAPAATSGTYGGMLGETGGPPGGMRDGGQAQDPSKAMHPGETLLTGTVADKVTAAAKAKEPGATIERVETDAEGVYEAHMVRADGTHIIVQIGKDFAVTAVQTGGPGGGGPGGHRADRARWVSRGRAAARARTGEGASSTT